MDLEETGSLMEVKGIGSSERECYRIAGMSSMLQKFKIFGDSESEREKIDSFEDCLVVN